MLLKFNTNTETDEALEWLKAHYEVGTGSKAAQAALMEFPAMYAELQEEKRRLGALRHQMGELKAMVRERNRLDVAIREACEQTELEL